MHVFVATPLTQGTQPDDHYCCLDGEIVIWDTTSVVEHEPGDPCECGTGFFGSYTGGRSTTAMVADDPEITELDLLEIVRRTLLDETGSDRDALSMVHTVADAAARFAPGDVVERREVIAALGALRTRGVGRAQSPLGPRGRVRCVCWSRLR